MTDTPAERGADSTWARLRRRKVVQWGLAYVAGAWALVQVISHAVTTFHWPEQIQQIATLLLLIGLPVAVVLAWYHGDRGEQRIRGTELAILSLLLLVGGGLLWRYQNASETPPSGASTTSEAAAKATPATAAPDGKSIAVLPFVNLSSDAEQEYFSDGIAEQVLDLLSGVSGLRVIARTSSFSFKGKNADVSEIAQRLNVSHVLQGSVRRAGNRVRVAVQLIRSSDSSQMWSTTYDRELIDIFTVQDEIAAAVVRQLRVALLGGKLPSQSATTNVEAYNLYLQARYLSGQHSLESMEKAVHLYERALAIDPAYAEAWAALAEVHATQADEAYTDVPAGIAAAREAAEKALELNSQLAKAHAVLGLIQFAYDWKWSAAEASLSH